MLNAKAYERNCVMRYEKNRKIAGIDEFKLIKSLKILAIPIIVLVLVVVIVVVDRVFKSKAESMTDAQSSESVVESVINTVDTYDFSNYRLDKDSNQAVMDLVSAYQTAKIEADAKAMYKVFGRGDTDGLSELQNQLNTEKKVYEAYENVSNYIGPGLNQGEYVVYMSADIKFKGIITPAPMLTWAYIKTFEDGSLYMIEPDKLDEQQKLFVDKVSTMEDVKLLDSAMRKRLAEVLISDAQLAALYQIWLKGEDVSKYDISLGTGEDQANSSEANLEDDDVQIGAQSETAEGETSSESEVSNEAASESGDDEIVIGTAAEGEAQ